MNCVKVFRAYNRNRYRRTDTNVEGKATTPYVARVEKVIKPDGSREIRHYVTGEVMITQEYAVQNNYKHSVTRYVLKDHLGTTDVIANAYGTIEQEQSFDAWGLCRVVADGESLSLDLLSSLAAINNEFTTKGFTGHESVDEVGIIHMNGRIYEPRLARFLQADPKIDGADTTQGYNRYSYVQNKPLIATDPSSYASSLLNKVFDDVLGFTENLILNTITQIAVCYFGTALGCAAYASALTYGASGDIGLALAGGYWRGCLIRAI